MHVSSKKEKGGISVLKEPAAQGTVEEGAKKVSQIRTKGKRLQVVTASFVKRGGGGKS